MPLSQRRNTCKSPIPQPRASLPRNLRRMRDFYRMYGDAPELLAAAMRLNWTQNVVIMEAGLTMDEVLVHSEGRRKRLIQKGAAADD